MRTVAIVQARLGSTRLPGKVLKDLCGKPVLEHVMERLQRAQSLDEVVVAIPDAASDDALAEFCARKGYAVFRGSEQDVLARYWGAAQAFDADTIVRITSDCPLIDPTLVNTIVRAHTTSGSNDYTCNVLVRSFPRGLDTEVLSRQCLARLHARAKHVRYREHVTNFIHDNPGDFKTQNVARQAGDRSDLRICVDTPEDFAVVEAIVKGVRDGGIEDVIRFLDGHPRIASLNAHVQQAVKTLRAQAS